MNNPPPIFITSTMVFIAYSTIISMLRGLSRIGFRVLSDGFRSIRFSSIFSDTLRYIGWRGTSESGSNEKKERKKGFDTSPTWIGRKKIFFHRWISFKAFRSRSRKEGRGPSSVRKAFRKLETRTWDGRALERGAILNRESVEIRKL